MNKIKPYIGILASALWIIIYSLIHKSVLEHPDFRFFFVLAILAGSLGNWLTAEQRIIRLIYSILIYLSFSFVFDWYSFVDSEIVSSSSFFTLFIKGFVSIDRIISFSSHYFSSLNLDTLFMHIMSLIVLAGFFFFRKNKFCRVADIDELLKAKMKYGFLALLIATMLLSGFNLFVFIRNSEAFYQTLDESQRNYISEPNGISIFVLIRLVIFVCISVFSLYFLRRRAGKDKVITILFYFLILFLSASLFDLVSGNFNQYSWEISFDGTLFFVLEIVLLSIVIVKFNPVLAYPLSIFLVWIFKIFYQYFSYPSNNLAETVLDHLFSIHIPLLGGLIAGIAYYYVYRLLHYQNR